MSYKQPAQLAPLLIGGGGLIFAVYLGLLAGRANFTMLAAIFGIIGTIAVCLWLRTAIWLLIPFCWNLTGKIAILPIPFSVRDISIMLVATMFCIFFALKMVRFKSETGWLELLVALNVTYVISMYIRHPVGTSSFGSDMVGGRPYFNVIIGLIAFLLFRLVTISHQQARMFPFFLLAGSLMVTGLNLLVRFVPALAPVVAPLYSGINASSYLEAQGFQAATTEGQRFIELAGPSGTIVEILSSYFKPLGLLLPSHPGRMLLLVGAILGLLLSGYRSAILGSVCFYLFACYFHGGFRDLMRGLLIGFVTILGVVILQLSVGLPLQAQRALSFIPLIQWNEAQKKNADDSTQWRVDMWKMAWNEKKYINDKIWGDGFGFSAYELSIALNSQFGGTGYIGGAEQEAFMVNGAFHSGPLSTIRFAGIVGLILYLIWVSYMAFQAPALIQLARGTPFFPTMIFFFMPMIYGPFFFLFIYGAYDSALPDTFFQAGLFRMIKNSFLDYRAKNPPVISPEKAVEKRLVLNR